MSFIKESVIYITDLVDENSIRVEKIPELNGKTTEDGYGDKLPTHYILQFTIDSNKISRKVYAICWSNVASFYILLNKQKVFIPEYILEQGK